jgi:putative SOS response-associated peptidase YedK
LLAPPPDDLLEIVDVSPKLNNPRSEGPELMHPPGSSGPSAA